MLSLSKVKELSLFFNMPKGDIQRMDNMIQDTKGFAKWINIATEDWVQSKINQNKKTSIEKWFKNNDKYIFELCDVHSQEPKKKIFKHVVKVCKKNKAKSILDYGGGIGEESLLAAISGFKASLADLPSLTFDFAKWRAKYYSQKIEFIKVSSDTPLKKSYDAITCFEVIQHLYNPEKVVKHLINHLNPNGLFFVTTRFNNPNYPIALKKNYKYKEGMTSFIEKNGCKLIKKIYQYGRGKRSKYLYVYQKIQND